MSGFTHFARPFGVRENELVDNDVVCVNAALGQLLDQSLRLVQGEELGDANTDEGGLFLMDAKKRKAKLKKKVLLSQLHKTNIKIH